MRKYNRIFILLNGRGEGIGLNLNGSCDIEIINGKGKLYAYIGGMGRMKNKPRNLYLLSAGIVGTTAVSAGEFEIKGSNAVLETSFDPDNVFESGMTIEDINTAAVWNPHEGAERAVLEGFVSQKTYWTKNLDIYGENKEYEIKENCVSEEIDRLLSNKKFEEIEKELDDAVDENANLQAAETAVPIDFKAHDTFRSIAEKFRKELEMLDELGIIDKNSILKGGTESYESTESRSDNILERENNERAKITSEADVLFEKNEKMPSSGRNEWIKADYREAYMIPEAIVDLRRLFVRNCARKGRHVILGRNDKKYYIGVPGNENQREEANTNGFHDFMTIGDMNGNGYWIKDV